MGGRWTLFFAQKVKAIERERERNASELYDEETAIKTLHDDACLNRLFFIFE